MSKFTDRMWRAAKLDAGVYEEVEADKSAMGQAMGAVVLSSLAAGVGNIAFGFGPLILMTVVSLLGWYAWAFAVYFIGTKWLPEPQTKADYGQLLRTIGFSSSPGVIRVLGVIPGLSAAVTPVAGIWMLVSMVIAVRQSLDYKSTGRAVGVCLLGWLVYLLLVALLLSLAGMGGRMQGM
ncbi:MAG: hypothetical protein A3C36_03115 [Omnitrophica WOR_2 bacterium RIFCSPHIGHO2_02_FULL_52_10]|nr:MAG: hypothetical protein A3C36_03115 [Omnitrophica WOR_2 bacterium RIFCSPHIGHO2_02_FULL_52_10]